MNFKISSKTARLATTYGVTPDELVFADLIAAGWDTKDAYFVAFNENVTWTDSAVNKITRILLSKTQIKTRIRELRKCEVSVSASDSQKESVSDDDVNLLDEVSKENMLKDLLKAKRNLKPASKEWNEINKMIVEITRMKHEELKTEDNTVHYFLPLTCRKCSLYMNANKQ